MADRLDGKLDPRAIAPSFDRFPSMNAPAPTPLALSATGARLLGLAQFTLCGEHRYHF